jgi:hypothetical protein
MAPRKGKAAPETPALEALEVERAEVAARAAIRYPQVGQG